MKAYLLEKYSDMKDAYTANRLKSEAEKRGIDFEIIGENDFIFNDGKYYKSLVSIDGRKNDIKELKKADVILLRSKNEENLHKISGLSDFFINPLDKYIRFLDKGNELSAIYDAGINFPKYQNPFSIEDAKNQFLEETKGFPACFNNGENFFMNDLVHSTFSSLVDELKIPFIMKGLKSSMGKEIFLIRDFDAFKCTIEKFPLEKKFLYEEYIEGGNRDIRLFIINGEIIAAMERENKNDFRSNVALGSTVRPVKVTDEMHSIADTVYERTGLDVIGLDLLHGKDGLLFCELNVMPGLKGIEESSGKNIAGEIITMAMK